MKKFTSEPLFKIIEYFDEIFKTNQKVSIEVLNPDFGLENYAGEEIKIEENTYLYRSYKSWNDLAELYFCKILTPILVSKCTICLTFCKINKNKSFHIDSINNSEKYGEESTFFRINKLEEPSFFYYYKQALLNVKIQDKESILNLGINKADEFEMIKSLVSEEKFKGINFTGIDFCESAIKYSKKRFDLENFKFYNHDISKIEKLKLNKFDLIISIGTLQSTSLNFKEVFMYLVQNYLTKNGAIILGFPNCRWHEGEIIYGAKAANYSFSEQSVLFKDVYFCKKYLQQKKYRVTLTGKNYLFLTATSIRK